MLHYAGDKNILAVANSIDLYLSTHKVFVDKHGVFYLLRKNNVHILDDVRIAVTYRHILSAEYVGRTKKRRITYLVGNLQGVFLGHYGKALRTLDFEFFEQLVKLFSVLRHIYILSLSTHNSDIIFSEHLG